MNLRQRASLVVVSIAFGGCSAVAFGADSVLLGGDETYISIAALLGIATIMIGGVRLLMVELRSIHRDIQAINLRLAGDYAKREIVDEIEERLRGVEMACAGRHAPN